jgi:ribosomal protein L24
VSHQPKKSAKPFAIGTHVVVTGGARVGMTGIVVETATKNAEVQIDGHLHRIAYDYLALR